MPTPWFRRVRRAGKLGVFNKAGAWKAIVDKALVTFNSLGFPVQLVATTDEKNAEIVVKLSIGPDSEPHWGQTTETGPEFDPKLLHGRTSTITEHDERRNRHEISFAGIFLPGRADATNGQKEVIVVHEFIHACGLNGGLPDGSQDPHQDHDSEGIMYDIMIPGGDGLIEGNKPDGVKSMPPIRVGGKTQCRIQMIWGTEACKD